MLKNLTQLELIISDKVYQLTCAPDSPIEHLKEALFQFQKYIGQIEDQVRSQQQANSDNVEKKSEENKEAS